MSEFFGGAQYISRDILGYIDTGDMSGLDYTTFVTLLLLVHPGSGKWLGSGAEMERLLKWPYKDSLTNSLKHLEDKGYILMGLTKKGTDSHLIVVNKYKLTMGDNAGMYVDLDGTRKTLGIPKGKLSKELKRELASAISTACDNPELRKFKQLTDRSTFAPTEGSADGPTEGGTAGGTATPTVGVTDPSILKENKKTENKKTENQFSQETTSDSQVPTTAPTHQPTPGTPESEQLVTLLNKHLENPATLSTPTALSAAKVQMEQLLKIATFERIAEALWWVFEEETSQGKWTGWVTPLSINSAPAQFLRENWATDKGIEKQFLTWKAGQKRARRSAAQGSGTPIHPAVPTRTSPPPVTPPPPAAPKREMTDEEFELKFAEMNRIR